MAASNAFFYEPSGLVRISGPDAATYLQGQFSNDLSSATVSTTTYGLWLNVKGKVQADSFLLRESEHSFLAFSYACPSERLVELIEAHIIMDEVEVESLQTPCLAVTLWGEAIDMVLQRFDVSRPVSGMYSKNGEAIAFQGGRDLQETVELVLLDQDLIRLMDDIKQAATSNGIRILDENQVSELAIRSSRFVVNKDILDSDLPQEAGLEQSAVSYSKGCYIGQEVMARLKSMGRARRRMLGVAIETRPEGAPPYPLLNDDGKKIGEIRRLVFDENGGAIGSAMVNINGEFEGSFIADGDTRILVRRIN